MEHQARVKQIIDNAKKQFAVNGVEWNDRVEAAVRNLITPFMTDIEHLTMPPETALVVIKALNLPNAREGVPKARKWLDDRYDSITGELID